MTLERALHELVKWGMMPTPCQKVAKPRNPESLELSQYEERLLFV